MRAALIRVVFCAVALMLTIGHADAQNPYPDWPEAPYVPDDDSNVDCGDFARYWVAVAAQARANGCVPNGDAWSTDLNEQWNYCTALRTAGHWLPGNVRDHAVKAIRARMAEMRLVMTGNCGACSVIADFQLYQAAGNALYQCRFSSDDGRWIPDRAYQIRKCLTVYQITPAAARASFVTMQSEMRAQMDECKRTHQPQGCMFAGCHSSNSSKSSSAVRAMPKSENALRDPVRQLQERAKVKDVKAVDPCKSGTRSLNFACNQPATKATNSSAMDSLQGLSPSTAPSGVREQGSSPSRPAPTAAPSAPAAPTPFVSKPR